MGGVRDADDDVGVPFHMGADTEDVAEHPRYAW
jgi:hypothetical protein